MSERVFVLTDPYLHGVSTRKCSECTTSWTKHERAARWYVRSTLGLSRTAAVDPSAVVPFCLQNAGVIPLSNLSYPLRIGELVEIALSAAVGCRLQEAALTQAHKQRGRTRVSHSLQCRRMGQKRERSVQVKVF
jgi:hypothetical protein